MKSLTLAVTCILTIGILGCIRNEEEWVVQSCEGFDFTIPERDWILLLPGVIYSFSSGDKTLKFNSKYNISEPFAYSYDLNSVTESTGSKCHGLYESTHVAEDASFIISNSIGYSKSLGIGHMNVGLQRMSMELKIINDTLSGRRTNYTPEDPDDYLFENIPSLKIGEKQYSNVFKISHSNPNTQPQEIYLAKREGLVAYVKNDSLWVREYKKP